MVKSYTEPQITDYYRKPRSALNAAKQEKIYLVYYLPELVFQQHKALCSGTKAGSPLQVSRLQMSRGAAGVPEVPRGSAALGKLVGGRWSGGRWGQFGCVDSKALKCTRIILYLLCLFLFLNYITGSAIQGPTLGPH